MPAAVTAVATWLSSAAAAAATAIGATTITAGYIGAVTMAVSEIALYAGMQYAIDAVSKPKLKPPGSELQFNMDPAYPREMIIGERLVGGSMVARYSRGKNLYNAHLVIQLADHPCTELSKVYDGGRLVQGSALTHGVRTEITAYSNSGGPRLWMTWHDGRPGQTADADLITRSAEDPEVINGTLEPWTSDHRGAGCAYVHVEVQWDSDILTWIPQFTWLVKGAPLYDRRLDTTAGGSGSQRLNDPSTWTYSTNARVALDHYLLGYKVESEDLAFGIGLSPSEVPYAEFAATADLCDEDVVTGTGDTIETIKRYAANGVLTAADYFEEVIEAFQIQMAARVVDLGGRIGILGAEERAVIVSLTDGDLVPNEPLQFADKLPFSDLYGSVAGTFADPANLYQPTPYDTQYTAYRELPDGGEAQAVTLPLSLEVHPRRAVRLASAWLSRESLQPRLIGVFMPSAWELEPGDWFDFTSDRLQLTAAKFEVIDIVKNDDFTVTMTARAIDPDFLAFSTANDPGLSVPPEAPAVSLLLDEPEFDVVATTLSAGGVVEPALEVTLTTDETVAREIVYEYAVWDAGAAPGEEATLPTLIDSAHASQLLTVLRKGVLPDTVYAVRAKARAGRRESPWTAWSTPVTTGATYAVGSASSVPWSGVTGAGRPEDNATVGATAGTDLYRTDGTTVLTQAEVRTAEGTAAAITSQGALATLGQVNFGVAGRVYRDDGTTRVTDALAVTSLGTAAAITSQGALATASQVNLGASGRVYRDDGATRLTDALAVTSLGTAAAIAGQGSLATASSAAWGSQVSGRPTNLAALTGSEAVNNALVPVGSNMLVDTGFRWQSTYWTSQAQSGTATFSVETSTAGLRKSVLTGSGLTVGNFIRQYAYNQRAQLQCKPGDVVGARVLVGGVNVSAFDLRITWRDAAGAYVANSTVTNLASGILSGTGEETTFNEMTTYGTAPTGTVAADIDIFAYASTAAPVFRIAKPMLTLMAAGQTVVPPYAPGREHEVGANVTETRTAAAITSQGALATVSQVNLGASGRVYRDDGTTRLTDALAVTSLGTAAAITGQGALATVSSVTAPYISVGDPTNFCLDPNFDTASYWTLSSGATLDTSTDVTGTLFAKRAVKFTASGANPEASKSAIYAANSSTAFAVEPSTLYRLKASTLAKSGFNGRLRMVMNFYTQGGVFISGAQVSGTDYRSAAAGSDTTGTLDGQVTTPSNAAFGNFYINVEWPGAAASAGTAFAAMPRVSRAISYSLLTNTAVRLGTNITRNDGTTSLTDALAVTSLGTAAAIASQGALATASQVNLGASGKVYRDDGTTRLTDALAVTSLGTAAAFTGQGALATLGQVNLGASGRVYRDDGATRLTDALAVTSLGTAAAITGQGQFATASHQRGTSWSGTPTEGCTLSDTSTNPERFQIYTGGVWRTLGYLIVPAQAVNFEFQDATSTSYVSIAEVTMPSELLSGAALKFSAIVNEGTSASGTVTVNWRIYDVTASAVVTSGTFSASTAGVISNNTAMQNLVSKAFAAAGAGPRTYQLQVAKTTQNVTSMDGSFACQPI